MYNAIQGLEFRDVGTETLVYDVAREKVHVLNRTAADLLRVCSGKTPAQLSEYLRDAYEADGHDVDRDVDEIMSVFLEQGLVLETAQ